MVFSKAMGASIPVVVEFAAGIRIFQEEEAAGNLPPDGDELPGTFAVSVDGRRVPLPTDQIVLQEEEKGRPRLGFGGMSFEGKQGDHLVFWRVRDVLPEGRVSSEHGDRMLLSPDLVKRVWVQGNPVWPRRSPRPAVLKGSGRAESP